MKQCKNSCTEFEVQAYLWSRLNALGYTVRGEIKVRAFDGRKGICRLDLAEVENGTVVGLIEIKRCVRKHKTDAGWHGTRQGSKYAMLGVPIQLIYGMDQAVEFAKLVEERGYLLAPDNRSELRVSRINQQVQ